VIDAGRGLSNTRLFDTSAVGITRKARPQGNDALGVIPSLGDIYLRRPPTLSVRLRRSLDGLVATPIIWETGMNMYDTRTDICWPARGRASEELAERIEGSIERAASGRIRDLHVVCSEDSIILQGRSRTYHAKQLAQQAALDLTDGYPLLTNQIVVC
jgi:hypothetical protein